VQPALKTRGREYVRIIYGPEYDLPENRERLRSRGLSSKRSLALREFALGIEGLERFVRGEPLAASTSAPSACSRWKVSRSIQGCDGQPRASLRDSCESGTFTRSPSGALQSVTKLLHNAARVSP